MCKLWQLRIVGTLYGWFEHYLTGRSQKGVINSICFSLRYLRSGISQGSVLCPLLLLSFINCIIYDPRCYISLFADNN